MQSILSKDNSDIKNVIYSGDLYARKLHEDGRPYHTFRTYSLLVDGNNISFENCLFENTAGRGENVGQAIALYLDGNNIKLKNCIIFGHQDTLFLGPLPPKEYEKDGFLGPKQFTQREDRTFYFESCIIYGGVDFIFGGATAYFDNCQFISNEAGYVFAPCTPEHVKEGFVARNCRFLCQEGISPGSCFIARPWRDYAKVRIENCYLDYHINPKGWDDWGKKAARDRVLFEEKNSYGPGAADHKRPEYVHIL
ncbi:MAG: pectin methylesterase [Eubacterium sp.]|nr:pectin methylesterase [Eubacterium sp.]